MKILVTSTEMKQIEDKIFRSGVTSEDLIEKAGTSIANFIEKNFSNLTKRSIFVITSILAFTILLLIPILFVH